jgi:hypothetical protein
MTRCRLGARACLAFGDIAPKKRFLGEANEQQVLCPCVLASIIEPRVVYPLIPSSRSSDEQRSRPG